MQDKQEIEFFRAHRADTMTSLVMTYNAKFKQPMYLIYDPNVKGHPSNMKERRAWLLHCIYTGKTTYDIGLPPQELIDIMVDETK